jgi:hypothetical protein
MLDEPSLGLAPKLVAEVFEIIKGINAQGKTVLLVEQNAFAALQGRPLCLCAGGGNHRSGGRGRGAAPRRARAGGLSGRLMRAPGPLGLRPSIPAEACFSAWWEWFDLTDNAIPAGEENTI